MSGRKRGYITCHRKWVPGHIATTLARTDSLELRLRPETRHSKNGGQGVRCPPGPGAALFRRRFGPRKRSSSRPVTRAGGGADGGRLLVALVRVSLSELHARRPHGLEAPSWATLPRGVRHAEPSPFTPTTRSALVTASDDEARVRGSKMSGPRGEPSRSTPNHLGRHRAGRDLGGGSSGHPIPRVR